MTWPPVPDNDAEFILPLPPGLRTFWAQLGTFSEKEEEKKVLEILPIAVGSWRLLWKCENVFFIFRSLSARALRPKIAGPAQPQQQQLLRSVGGGLHHREQPPPNV